MRNFRVFTTSFKFIGAAVTAALLYPSLAHAASCCGGGSASSLIMPKFSGSMLDISFDMEKYDGFWNKSGTRLPDPPGSDLKQYRLNIGYGKRLGSRWQGSIAVPYVWNANKYSGISSSTQGLGDATFNIWYEAFDNVQCIWTVNSMADLAPAAYFGASLTVPTGLSPYDNVNNSFDVTGRGFYRLDANMLLEKTIYPWTASLLVSYGRHFERPVNREYGNYVKPYFKNLGDRRLYTLSLGYTYFMESMNTLTLTGAYSDLWEGEGVIDGRRDPTTGMEKKSIAWTLALASMDRDWVLKFTWNQAIKGNDMGRNFPTTDIFTIGVSHVFR